jgi:probable DNA metabolism protein
MTLIYDGSFEGLFAVLAGMCRGGPVPDRVIRQSPGISGQPELFGGAGTEGSGLSGTGAAGREDAVRALEAEFFEASAGAYGSFLHAWMSELPIERELLVFARRVITAARKAGGPGARAAAEAAATDRGDPAVRTVLAAAYRVSREMHRLLGLLRFSPGSDGSYHARCGPDHFVLPALAGHFYRRFGETPWIIIDEKRRIALVRESRAEPRLIPWAGDPPGENPGADPWEALWRHYHGVINNEQRRNPALQKQCMPLRYWKYLPEMRPPR